MITAWVSEQHIDGPFSAEAMAADMAFRQGALLQTDNLIIEGDALNVIQNITKTSPVPDWRGQEFIQHCQAAVLRHPNWKILFVPNSCNEAAHHLVAWAAHSSICGVVSPSQLPTDVLFCDSDTMEDCTSSTLLVADDING